MTMPHIIHALFVAADKLERVSDELPAVTEPQAILLTAIARAAQLTAEHLKQEEAERERKVVDLTVG
jgi:hypothetical protein